MIPNPHVVPTRRLRAAIIGLGLDGRDGTRRILKSDQALVVGGSAETHDELVETILRLETELERRGRDLAEVSPEELMEIAWRIDSPDLLDLAIRMREGVERAGTEFRDMTPEELTNLSWPEED